MVWASAEKSSPGCGFPPVAAASPVCCPDLDAPLTSPNATVGENGARTDLIDGAAVGSYALSPPGGESVTLTVGGDWSIRQGLPSLATLKQRLTESSAVRRILLGAGDLGKWDSSLPSFVLMVSGLCREHDIAIESTGLPAGVRRLVELATATPPRELAKKKPPSFLARVGASAIEEGRSLAGAVTFLGES